MSRPGSAFPVERHRSRLEVGGGYLCLAGRLSLRMLAGWPSRVIRGVGGDCLSG